MLTKAAAPSPPRWQLPLCAQLSAEERPRGASARPWRPGLVSGNCGVGGRGGDRSSLSLSRPPPPCSRSVTAPVEVQTHPEALLGPAAGGSLGSAGVGGPAVCLGPPGPAGGGRGSESIISPDPMTPGMCTCALLSACVCMCVRVCTYVSWGERLAGLCPKPPSCQGRWD